MRATPRVVRRIRMLIYKCSEQFLACSANAYTVRVIIIEPALSSLVLWGLWQAPPGTDLQWKQGEKHGQDGSWVSASVAGFGAELILSYSKVGRPPSDQHWLSWAHCTQQVLPVSSETPAEIHGESGSSIPNCISGAPHLLQLDNTTLQISRATDRSPVDSSHKPQFIPWLLSHLLIYPHNFPIRKWNWIN